MWHGARTMRTVQRRRLGLLLAVVAIAAAVLVLLAGGQEQAPQRLVPGVDARRLKDPLTYEPARKDEYERRAAAGLVQPLFEKSPGGAVASARRVAALRPLIEAAAGKAWD